MWQLPSPPFRLHYKMPIVAEVDVWTLLWVLLVTDFVIKFATVAVKCCIFLLPSACLLHRRRVCRCAVCLFSLSSLSLGFFLPLLEVRIVVCNCCSSSLLLMLMNSQKGGCLATCATVFRFHKLSNRVLKKCRLKKTEQFCFRCCVFMPLVFEFNSVIPSRKAEW